MNRELIACFGNRQVLHAGILFVDRNLTESERIERPATLLRDDFSANAMKRVS